MEAAMTPMLRQYFDLKTRCPEAVLFFRMGDFYEIFGEDAQAIAPKLSIVLTSRERGDQTRIPFCGVPHHSARNYWLRLLAMGFKVAIADQMEDASQAKGLVKRDITRILTPGSVDDADALDADSPNYLMALLEEPTARVWAVALLETSTGEIRCGTAPTLAEAAGLIARYRPTEVLIRRFFEPALRDIMGHALEACGPIITHLPEGILRNEAEQREILEACLGGSDLASQPCGAVHAGRELLAATLSYLKSLNAAICQFVRVAPLVPAERMTLDEVAIRDLELFESSRRRETKGSLFGEINHTLTPMGARLLKVELAAPLLGREAIVRRHEAVAALALSELQWFEELRGALKGMPDLERLFTRVVTLAVTPQEIARIFAALRQVATVHDRLAALGVGESTPLTALLPGMVGCRAALETLEAMIDDHSTLLAGALDLVRTGFDSEFDCMRQLALNGQVAIDRYEEELKGRTGIGSLKIKDHKSFGLLIEVTKTHLTKVPKDFIRRQTMVNCERFVTFELQELDASLKVARDLALDRERHLYVGLLERLACHKQSVRAGARSIALTDMLQAFAHKARKESYVRPELSDDGRLELEASRHPVVERSVGRHEFTPNDIKLTRSERHLLITGPNMAGKSTVMRQTALSVLLCQIGAFVPARRARMPVFDRVFTRVGAADDLARGQSTFMVEMAETASILRHATSDSLVILDEIGRGTSTQDGLAIAGAILEEIAQTVRCYAMFATHFHEIVPFAAALPSVRTIQTEVTKTEHGTRFRHRLIDGAAGSSFGLEVAQLAGLPARVITRAREIVAGSVPPQSLKSRRAGASRAKTPPLERLGFAVSTPETSAPQVMQTVLERLETVVIDSMTPLQAINLVADLKGLLASAKAVTAAPRLPCFLGNERIESPED